MSIFNKLFGTKEVESVQQEVAISSPDICLFYSDAKPVVNYTEKDNRADKVNFRGIGSSKYGSGTPPALYDKSITAVKSFPIVYGCITAISEAIASLNVKVYEVNGGQKTEVTDHPFYQLFSRPNPYQGSYEFLEELQQTLDVMGNVFIGIEKVAGTLELYLLNPKYVAILPDPRIKVKGYVYYINGETVKYKPEEIIHIKYTDVDDPYYGIPPLSAATDVLSFETSRLKYANQFFINGAIPTGVLETDSNLGDSLLKKLRSEWSNLHRGVSNSHKVAILQGGLKYRNIASPIKDLDFKALKEVTKEDILTIYKVPESVLGNQSGTGSNEGKSALTAFWRGSLVPRLKRIESCLSRGLSIDVFGQGKFYFEFNIKEIEALQEDKVAQSQYLKEMMGSSVLTANECRAVLGYPRIEDEYADKLLISNSFFGNALLPADAATAAASAGGAGSTQEKPAVKPIVAPNPSKPKPAKTTPEKKPKK